MIGAHDPSVEEHIPLISQVRPGAQHSQEGGRHGHLQAEGDERTQDDESRPG